MSRARTLPEYDNVECPCCGSVLTRCRGGGRADSGERLRRRVCQDCRTIFTTAEVVLLYDDGEPVPISALDGSLRAFNRNKLREMRGYHATTSGRRPIVRSAQLSIRVRVQRPELERAA